jgi:hypothetical protein
MHAELDAVICSGPRRGKQFTYALLDERAPNARRLQRDEALAELVERYFTAHGPAQVQDFVWWSGLTVADTKTGIEMLKPHLTSEVVDGKTYWLSRQSAHTTIPPVHSPTAYLLPTYDEYGIGYKDRSALIDPQYAGHIDPANILIDNPYYSTISMDGKIVGFWKRTLHKSKIDIETRILRPLNEAETRALNVEIERYGRFHGLLATLRA